MGLLDGVLGGSQRRGGGMNPAIMALLGALAVHGYQNRDKLGSLFGGNPSMGGTGMGGQSSSGGLGGLLGGLGGMLGGGASGGALSGGLGDLMDRFQRQGQGETAQSWVSTGPNRPIAPDQLEETLGFDTIDALQKQTGLPREELL